MSRLELVLTLTPPVSFLLLFVILDKPFASTVDRQCLIIGRGANFTNNQIIIMQQVAKSAVGLASLLPAILGFLAITAVVIYCYGLFFLFFSLAVMVVSLPLVFIVSSRDFCSLHDRVQSIFNTDKRPFSFTYIEFVNNVVIYLNLLFVILILLFYPFSEASCSATEHLSKRDDNHHNVPAEK